MRLACRATCARRTGSSTASARASARGRHARRTWSISAATRTKFRRHAPSSIATCTTSRRSRRRIPRCARRRPRWSATSHSPKTAFRRSRPGSRRARRATYRSTSRCAVRNASSRSPPSAFARRSQSGSTRRDSSKWSKVRRNSTPTDAGVSVQGPSGVPLVDVTRGPAVESVHAVAACAVDARGREMLVLGDVDVPIFLRSSAKPFIAGAIVASGAAAHYDLDDREIAVICASHNGEAFHVETVRAILQKIGLDESDLRCGAHAPAYEPAAAQLAAQGRAPSAIHNNCSGKHAGILAMCRHLGVDHASYLAVDNPAMRRVLAFCARLSDDDAPRWPGGVDGCGIPAYATPLRRAALAFARLATLEGLAREDASAL